MDEMEDDFDFWWHQLEQDEQYQFEQTNETHETSRSN